MGQIVLHYKDAFNLYDTITDSAVFKSAITKEQLYTYIKDQHGRVGVDGLSYRLARAVKCGTSSMLHDSLEELLECNRAGPKESCLSTEEFIMRFLTLKGSA